MTISLVSLGCAKNAVDLQVMAGNLIKEGATLSPDPDRADVVIVNTCSFIASAREEAEREIRRAIELKRRGQYGKVIVTGCYPQRYPERISEFCGVDEWKGVPSKWIESKLPGMRLTGKAFAYLKIAEGCVHRCSYCAIPLIRGKYRSRPMASIIREAKALLSSGCREMNIVAQDPMLWRDGGKRLVDLLWALDGLSGDFWLRVLYSYPSEVDAEFIRWLRDAKHAVPYVDIPIQHTVDAVLEKMNRGVTIGYARELADTMRECVPDLTFRTTIMTGFPGETESRFNELMADLRRIQFDHLGAFAYSPEEGTSGAKMRGRPSKAVAIERERKVMDLQSRLWKVRAKRHIGKVYRALVVAPGVARMASQAPEVDGVTFVNGGEVGEFIKVRLEKVKGFDFIGSIVKR